MATDKKEEKKQKPRFKQPSAEEQTTDLSSLDRLGESLGIPKVPAPKTVLIIFKD